MKSESRHAGYLAVSSPVGSGGLVEPCPEIPDKYTHIQLSMTNHVLALSTFLGTLVIYVTFNNFRYLATVLLYNQYFRGPSSILLILSTK